MTRTNAAVRWYTTLALFSACVALCEATQAVTAPPLSCNQPAPEAVAWVNLPGDLPFQALPSADGCWIFVSLASGKDEARNNDPKGKVALLRREGGQITLKRSVAVGGNPAGMVLTHDGLMLIVADGNRIAFLDTRRLISGQGSVVLGYWNDDARMPGRTYVNVTSDDHYIFVSDEQADTVSVIRLTDARDARHFKPEAVGRIPVGVGPVAVTLSADEHYLYTTTITMPPSDKWPATCVKEWDPSAKPQPQGAIFVIDVERAKINPRDAVISTSVGGCSPVRLVLSDNGDTAYVSGRGENNLLVFDTSKLINDPSHALRAKVPTGQAPIGIALVDGGRKVIVSNSNRFGASSDSHSLVVIDAEAIDTGAAAIVGNLPAQELPREMRVTSDQKTLLVVNTMSQKLEVLDLDRINAQIDVRRR